MSKSTDSLLWCLPKKQYDFSLPDNSDRLQRSTPTEPLRSESKELQPRREHVPNTRVLLARPQKVSFYDPRLQLFSAALGECGWSSYSSSIESMQLGMTPALPRNRNHAQIHSNNQFIELIISRYIAPVSSVLHTILYHQHLESRAAQRNMDTSSRIFDSSASPDRWLVSRWRG